MDIYKSFNLTVSSPFSQTPSNEEHKNSNLGDTKATDTIERTAKLQNQFHQILKWLWQHPFFTVELIWIFPYLLHSFPICWLGAAHLKTPSAAACSWPSGSTCSCLGCPWPGWLGFPLSWPAPVAPFPPQLQPLEPSLLRVSAQQLPGQLIPLPTRSFPSADTTNYQSLTQSKRKIKQYPNVFVKNFHFTKK